MYTYARQGYVWFRIDDHAIQHHCQRRRQLFSFRDVRTYESLVVEFSLGRSCGLVLLAFKFRHQRPHRESFV